MLSVIVPVFNVESYLEEAIESIIHQTYKDIEIILVDDGSTDGSGEICDIYKKKDSRIEVIHQSNKGLSAARNAGLDICAGEYIAFLDSDDAFCEDFARIMLKSIEMHDADIVECNYAILHSEHRMNERRINSKQRRFSRKIDRIGTYNTKEALNVLCNGKIAVNVWNKVYKRNIWDNLRFREGQNFEDRDIIFHVLENAEKVCLIDESLVLHRKRKGSITQTCSFENVVDKELAQQHFCRFIDEHIPLYFESEIKYRYYDQMAGSLLSEYHRYAWRNMPEKDKCLNFLKEKIDAISQQIDLKHSSIKVKVAFFVYYHMPQWIAVIIFATVRLIFKIFKIVNR